MLGGVADHTARKALPMADVSATHDELDDAIRAHAQSLLTPGELIVAWVVLAATRRHDGGGVVIHMPSNDVMPAWEARGIIAEGLIAVGHGHGPDDDEDE